MALDVKIHEAQSAILRELLFHPQAGFAQLQKPTKLSSDHFNFHIARLVELGMVEKKIKGQYALTHKGKEYANKMDTDNNTIERQPKVAVCLVIYDEQGRTLVQQRLKQPYYGYWGRPTGKVRWGETILHAAARELKEETNLTADLTFRGVQHKRDYNKQTGDLFEDKLFFFVRGDNPKGTLIERFEGGYNKWMTDTEIFEQEHTFVTEDSAVNTLTDALFFVETRHEYAPEHY